MKKRLNDMIELLIGVLVAFWWIPTIVIIIWINYMIAVSDLPDWFKFYLLK